MTVVKIHTAMEDRTASGNIPKILAETIKQVFWLTSINYQRPNLKIQINDLGIKDLVDTEADVTIITTKYLHSNLFLQEVNIQSLVIRTLS